jgi:hypothetical protein
MGDMPKLPTLTAERRDLLSVYLSDDQRLSTEYPNVADYLRAASNLPGTGDGEGDAAFDLRFLHFMTGGPATSKNPYWDIVAPSVSSRDGRRVVDGGNPEGSAQLAFAQMILQAAYAYAIPSPETIEWMSGFCAGLPVLEVGAGRGYWAAQLSRAGLVVDAYELEPPDSRDNVSFPQVRGQDDVWHTVRAVDELSGEDMAGHVLFLCWPPGWENPMASETLAAFEASGGERLVYVGEPRGGKTGDGAFFDALADRWALESSDPEFVSWWNLSDAAQGWARRKI